MSNSRWFSVPELSNMIGISEAAIKQWKSRGKLDGHYRYVKGAGQGGKELRISFDGVPEKYHGDIIHHLAQNDTEPDLKNIDIDIYAELKNYQKEHVDLWLNLFEKFEHLKGQQLKEALAIYKEENPDVSCSYATFRRKKKEYDKMGIAGIAPGWGKREGETKIKDEDFKLFKSLYLVESRPHLKSCWNKVRGAAYQAGRDVTGFPHPRTFKRLLEKNIPESAIYLARHGKDAWKRKYANYANRDKSSIKAGSCWVSDHRQLDVFVKNPDTGDLYRPWLTAWMDYKSGKWLSWYLHEEAPNSDHIMQSFKWAVEEFGKPSDIYIDNGKDYRSKDFAGGRSYHKVQVDERNTRSLTAMMGIKAHFAIPYNSQAKNIEPAFRMFIEYLEKHLVGYTGSTAQDRPEETKKRAKRGQAIDANTFKEMWDRFIREAINKKPSQGKEHKGLSRDELFYNEFNEKQAVRPEALKVFCMRTTPRAVTIMRNGVLDSRIGQRYWGEWMVGQKGTKVYLRRDIKKWEEAWVFDADTDDFIGKAYLDESINGLATGDLDRQKLRDKQAQKRREKRLLKRYQEALDRPSPQEILEWEIAGVKAENEQRKASGDFLDYTEDVKVARMSNTKADEILDKERKMRKTGTDDLDDIAPDEDEQQSQLNSIWDE